MFSEAVSCSLRLANVLCGWVGNSEPATRFVMVPFVCSCVRDGSQVSPCPSADELVVEMLSAITVSAADGGQGFLPLEVTQLLLQTMA